MGSPLSWVEDLIDGIKFYVENKIKSAPFDRTDTAIIKGTSDFGYVVEYNGKQYKDIKTIGGSCYADETVNIMIPQNNMNNMFILKSVSSSEILNLQNQLIQTNSNLPNLIIAQSQTLPETAVPANGYVDISYTPTPISGYTPFQYSLWSGGNPSVGIVAITPSLVRLRNFSGASVNATPIISVTYKRV